ncbi:putative cytochrome P450 oxidoreductase [Myxozyma melibiosi]|uniref:Cytochrome P450 oxidoreductase n=1 Tax=Myxozyma melibiosi TaxID=54550 RepID=A0ABR1F435_9ASCO
MAPSTSSSLLEGPDALILKIPVFSILTGVIILYLVVKILRSGRRDPRMPPGPPTLPILGNVHQIPSTGLGKKFREFADTYGPVFSLKVGSQNVVVLSDRKSINAMIDKKGSIFSDRPIDYVTNFVTHGDHLTLEKATASWREKRAIVTRNLSPSVLDQKHWKVQEAEAVIFMNNLLKHSDRILDYAKMYTTSVACTLIWGQRVTDFKSFWYKDFFELMHILPFLKYFPGKWKTRAYKCRQMMDDMWDKARAMIDERRAKGIKRDCFIDQKLDEYNAKGWPMSQHAFNNLFGELLEAGADTTANMILTLILAVAKYPEFQKRAQKEIDAVCGAERSPQFGLDFDKMPFVNCIVKEAMRWRPTAPLGLPHQSTEDYWYDGMLIPKGSTIFIGIWSIHHDESIYPDHETFNPDRYMNHPKLAPDYAASADFENRDKICPGLHLAERNMWRILAKLLWAFDISEPVDPVTGKVIPLDVNAYNSAILMRPLDFNVTVKPRSPEHLAAIRGELDSAMSFMSQWE